MRLSCFSRIVPIDQTGDKKVVFLISTFVMICVFIQHLPDVHPLEPKIVFKNNVLLWFVGCEEVCRVSFEFLQISCRTKGSKFTVKHFSHTCWFPFLWCLGLLLSKAGESNFLRVYRKYECKTAMGWMGVPFGSTQQKFIFKFRSWFTIKRRKKGKTREIVCVSENGISCALKAIRWEIFIVVTARRERMAFYFLIFHFPFLSFHPNISAVGLKARDAM